MPIIEPSALDSSGREHVCFFLKTFCKKFLHSAFLFMNIYDVPLEIALKCDCKVLGRGERIIRYSNNIRILFE